MINLLPTSQLCARYGICNNEVQTFNGKPVGQYCAQCLLALKARHKTLTNSPLVKKTKKS